MSRRIRRKYFGLERDCNMVSMFYRQFISFKTTNPTQKQIIEFVKKFHDSELEEEVEARRFIKKLSRKKT